MDSIEVVLVMLLSVAVSGYLLAALPISLPLPLVQIGLGAVIAGVFHRGHALDPEVFFFLFLPPLLFLDGWRIPKQRLFQDWRPILQLSTGLVVFTVIGAGYLIHWMIPAIPLPLAFALAAVVSPTDAVAVSAIASRVPMPKRLMHVLEGESLLNDASGLVCFQFAVAAALTGAFSLGDAVLEFLWVAAVGLAAGVGTITLMRLLQSWSWQRIGGEGGAAILVNLLSPFAAYLVAEALHASGILAAVAAGIAMSRIELSGVAPGSVRVQRTAVWDMVQFSLNGIMFVLLGEQLPGIVRRAMQAVEQTGHDSIWWLPLYALGLSAMLIALRFLWVWVSLRWSFLKSRWAGDGIAGGPPPWRILLAASLSGVRGAITLAGVLTLPLALPGGAPLPARELVIFLAASVILISLLLASLALPRLLRGLKLSEASDAQREEELARRASAKAALAAIEGFRLRLVKEDATAAALFNDAADHVSQLYMRQIQPAATLNEGAPEDLHRFEGVMKQLRLAALAAERDEMFRLAREGEISDELSRRLVMNLDLLEQQQH